jgi:hypothetical protein
MPMFYVDYFSNHSTTESENAVIRESILEDINNGPKQIKVTAVKPKDYKNYLFIFIPKDGMVPRQHFTVKHTIVRCRPAFGYRASDF